MGSGLGCGRLLAGWFALGVLAVSGFAQTQTQAGSARVSVEAGDPPAMASVPGEDEGPGGAVYDVRARLHREGGLPYRWMAKQILKAGVKAAGAATAKISLLGGPKAATLGGLLNAGLQNLVEVALPDVGRCGVDVEITAPASPERPFNRATNWAFGGDWALDIPFDPQGFTSPESGAFLNFDKAFPDAGPWDEREFVRAGSALSVTTADELSCTGATLEAEFEFERDDDHGDSAETATEISLGESVSLRLETEEDEDWFRFELEAGTLIKAAAFPESFDPDSPVSLSDAPPRSPRTEIVSSTGSCSERIDPRNPYGPVSGSPSRPCRSAFCMGGSYNRAWPRIRKLTGQVLSRCSAGVYFVRVNVRTGFAGVGKYTLRVWQDDHGDDTYGSINYSGGYEGATVVSVGSSTQGRIETPGDEDVFEFETTGAPNRRTLIQVKLDTGGLSGWAWRWRVPPHLDENVWYSEGSRYEHSLPVRLLGFSRGVGAVLAGRHMVIVAAEAAGDYTLHVRQIEEIPDGFCVRSDRDDGILPAIRRVTRRPAGWQVCPE